MDRTLIAEDLLLLLLDDQLGTAHASTDVALGGAVLIELALAGDVEVEEKSSVWRTAKVRATAAGPPADPVLAAALAEASAKERAASSLVGRLGKGLKETLADRLVERGILERRDDKVLGLFRRTRWPEADQADEADEGSQGREDAVRRQLTSVLVEGQQPDDRTGALIALLAAVDLVHKVVPHDGSSGREVRKRAREIADGAWAAKAVRDAIAAANAAVTAAVVSSTIAATAGGS